VKLVILFGGAHPAANIIPATLKVGTVVGMGTSYIGNAMLSRDSQDNNQ
jgi:hypothetical protein